ncbi:SusC/RagA family TonB-linked outer membrane protein [Bacteroides caecimuris]|uniref:SusC/RagA family TonB-linked outer membrane protein n=1 Tax=Bacteroides caecimuris TaxID=1796613 RepID=UPI0025703EB2|nr:TonB-dependent receptor [Bacteroides caecimuris]
MKKIFILYTLLLCSICMNVMAQQMVTVQGVVIDENKEPLIGVNVTVKDVPGLGAITDINGKYSIKMEPYHKLVFSYIGYTTVEVLVKELRTVNVTMKEAEAKAIDEVVITGTGVQRKLTQTGAISTVNVDLLKSNPSSSIVNSLAGNVPGIMARQVSGQPGKNVSEFWIRGISTFGASSSAYVLVDGFERDMSEINIEDIATFSVLKDASETAIYGSKGANGVVLITTKHGKAGKINIDAKVETSYNARTITPEFEDGFKYASLLNEARVTRNNEPIYRSEELDILRLGLDPDFYPNTDWQDMLLKDGSWSHRVNLNMNGGGTTARYFVSASYVKENGMYNTDESLKDDYNTNAAYHRWNYRLNTDIDITKTTLLKVGVAGFLSKRNSPGLGDADVWGELFGYNPIQTPVVYSDGRLPAIGTGNKTNPWVAATQTGFNEHWTNNIETNVSLEQKLDFVTKGLSFVGRFGYDNNSQNNIERHKWPEQWFAVSRDKNTGEIVWKKVSDSSNMTQKSTSEGDRREFFDVQLNWDRSFGNHHPTATLKYTQDSYVKTVNLGDDLKNGISRRNQDLAGRVAYNWAYRYFVNFNFGYNGSENFAKHNRFGFFPAASVAWNVAEESFVKKNLKWMNMFKVRFSYGKVGNDNMGVRFPYLYTIANEFKIGDNKYTYGGYNWAKYGSSNSYNGLSMPNLGSPLVTWEVATKKDLGIDLALFNDKFTGTIDYFDEKREGIYMERKHLPAIVGHYGVNPSANVGAMRSRGFDGHFNFRQKIGNVDVDIRGNMTYSKNEILEKDEENNVYGYQMERGYRVNQCRGLIALGLFKDYDDIRNSPKQEFGAVQPGDIKYRDVNGDGVVNDGDIVAIGATSKPNLIYGLGVTAKWKGLDVNVHFQGAGKSSFFTYGKCVYAFTEGEWGNVFKGMLDDRWVDSETAEKLGIPANENPNASYPRLSYQGDGASNNNYRNSTFWLRNGSYLRLKTVDVGYTLPKSWVNKLHFNNIRIFVVGTNLLTFSKFKTWDPEMGDARGESYPLSKSVTMGLSVNL